MRPDNSVLVGLPPGMSGRALAEQGKAYAVYLHVALPRKPKANKHDKRVQADIHLKLPAGRYQVEWVNTKTGAIDKSDTFKHQGGTKKMTSPQFVVDIALRIRKQ